MNAARKKEFLLDLFFPNRCPLCGKVIRWDIPYCEKCFDELPATGSELCRGCGNDSSYCECSDRKFNFLRCYSAFYYEGTAKSAVVYLKNTKNRIFPDIAAEKLYDDMANDVYSFKADLIVPVPVTRRKYKVKGFNHAEEIANSLSELLKIPVKSDALIKHSSFIAQHKLSAEMRKSNVGRLYGRGDPDGIAGKIIILCDDVKTTGATFNACAGILVEMGAAAVIAASAATTAK